MVEQFLFSQVNEIERESATGVVFQQDGSTPHFSPQVCLGLNPRLPISGLGPDIVLSSLF
jgi:hypothetical protein